MVQQDDTGRVQQEAENTYLDLEDNNGPLADVKVNMP